MNFCYSSRVQIELFLIFIVLYLFSTIIWLLNVTKQKKSWLQIRIGYGFWTLKIVKLSNVCDTMTRKHRILLNYLVNWAMFSKGNKRVEITIFLSSPVPCNWKGQINRQRVTSSPLLPPSYIPIPNPVSRLFFFLLLNVSLFSTVFLYCELTMQI